ncbi:hypothetical protein P7K49_025648 [Saguinus oedipus]|uniref:Uncharacterized protein n=1 Tax=Saguinus oedipus TaxID=9490 RepID=A0ABQ9UHS6_SAGOE|nr:hypothetical protein P7K49_025648 [Saguinus oedipus]
MAARLQHLSHYMRMETAVYTWSCLPWSSSRHSFSSSTSSPMCPATYKSVHRLKILSGALTPSFPAPTDAITVSIHVLDLLYCVHLLYHFTPSHPIFSGPSLVLTPPPEFSSGTKALEIPAPPPWSLVPFGYIHLLAVILVVVCRELCSHT